MPKAEAWAGLALEQQEAQRRAMLTQMALEEGQMRMQQERQAQRSDAATAQGYADLAKLPGQARQNAATPQQIDAHQYGQIGAGMNSQSPLSGQNPPMSQTDLLDAGLESILRRAHASGANARAMQALLQDGGEILQQAAALEDMQTLAQAWQMQATHDPVAAQVLQQMGAHAAAIGNDPIKAKALFAELYQAEQASQIKLQREVATSEFLAGQIATINDPAGPFAAYFDKYDVDGTLRAQMLQPLIEAQARNGAPGMLKSERYQQQADEMRLRMAQGGSTAPPGTDGNLEAPAPQQSPPAAGPIGEAIERRKLQAHEGERKAYKQTARSWRKDFSDEERSKLLLQAAAEIDRKGGTAQAAQEAVTLATSKGLGTWTGEKAEGDPDFAADLAYILSLPAKERKAALDDLRGEREVKEAQRKETRSELRLGTRFQ